MRANPNDLLSQSARSNSSRCSRIDFIHQIKLSLSKVTLLWWRPSLALRPQAVVGLFGFVILGPVTICQHNSSPPLARPRAPPTPINQAPAQGSPPPPPPNHHQHPLYLCSRSGAPRRAAQMLLSAVDALDRFYKVTRATSSRLIQFNPPLSRLTCCTTCAPSQIGSNQASESGQTAN